MNVAIITFFAPTNFGANLQALSSFLYLKDLGYNPILIHYIRPGTADVISRFDKNQVEVNIKFIKKYANISEEVYSKEEVVTLIERLKIDVVWFGSDAIWSYKEDGSEKVLFGDFISNCCRKPTCIAIAAAIMGMPYWILNSNQKDFIKRCISGFSYISVRDVWAKKNLDSISKDIYSDILPDPVFLGALRKLKFTSKLPENKYILISGLDKTFNQKWIDNLREILNRDNILLGVLPMPEGVCKIECDFIVHPPINPLEWFNWIKNSEAYIGLRFHALVSAIVNAVPFFIIDSYGYNNYTFKIFNRLFPKYANRFNRKSKISNLLNELGLASNAINNSAGITISKLKPKYVYKKINNISKSQLEGFSKKKQDEFLKVFDLLKMEEKKNVQ